MAQSGQPTSVRAAGAEDGDAEQEIEAAGFPLPGVRHRAPPGLVDRDPPSENVRRSPGSPARGRV